MKIPKEKIINGFKIKIEMVDSETIIQYCNFEHDREGRELVDNPPMGLFLPRLLKIYLNKDQNRQQLESTYIHEILEAIDFIYDMNLAHHQISLLESVLFGLGVKI